MSQNELLPKWKGLELRWLMVLVIIAGLIGVVADRQNGFSMAY